MSTVNKASEPLEGGAAYSISAGIVVVTVETTLTSDHAIEIAEAVLRDPAFERGMNSLWDLRKADIGRIQAEDLRRIGAHRRRIAPERGPHKTALLVDSDVSFGLARMYGALSERPPQSIEVFRDYRRALAWLEEPARPE